MALPQARHLPRSNVQETTGMLSYQRIVVAQDIQLLRPDSPLAPLRKIRTFKKLPMMRPNNPKMRGVDIRYIIPREIIA